MQGLWNETSTWGADPLRKWERKIALTIEYGGKAIYGGLTNLGAKATYGGADVEKIYAVATGVTDDMLKEDFEVIEKIDDQKQLVRITRFEYFSDTIPGLTERGLRFIEIAGNDEILFTLIGPQGADYTFEYGEYLFNLPILTHPSTPSAGQAVEAVHLIKFGDGDCLAVKTENHPVRFMLIAGAPFREPIVPYGPFVMNTIEEIQQTLRELRNGTFIK